MNERPFVSDATVSAVHDTIRRGKSADGVFRRLAMEEPELGDMLGGGFEAFAAELEKAGVAPRIRLRLLCRLRLGVARVYSAWQIARFVKWKQGWGGPASIEKEEKKP